MLEWKPRLVLLLIAVVVLALVLAGVDDGDTLLNHQWIEPFHHQW